MPIEAISPTAPRTRVSHGSKMFRALSHRNFRLFWLGAFLSNVGTWMQAGAQAWLVLQLTNSAFWLGLDAFMATIPGFFLTLIGGVFADLIDRRRLLIATQIGAGAAAIGLATLVWTGVVDRWMVLGFSFLTGCCMALASPSYLAMTYDLVGREDLANAIALNSTQFQLSRVIGPAMFGVGFKLFGLAGCFFANGLSFIAVIAALVMVRLDPRSIINRVAAPPAKNPQVVWRELVEGLRYVKKRPRVFSLLILSAVNSFFGAPYFAMVPIYARDIFKLGETGLAWMMSTAGCGALCGALLVAYLGEIRKKGWLVLIGAIAFGICVTIFALSTHLIISLTFLFGLGFALVVSVATTNTLLQQLVTDSMRGRVMSMFILSFMGTMPFGNIIAGWASHRFGAPHTLAVGGTVVALVAISMAIFNRRLRELY
ncbi:MAG: MFS transporter [Blastocatellia bacterium]|nr:MAG: MFS transporter [Blastocatellia bacterium]